MLISYFFIFTCNVRIIFNFNKFISLFKCLCFHRRFFYIRLLINYSIFACRILKWWWNPVHVLPCPWLENSWIQRIDRFLQAMRFSAQQKQRFLQAKKFSAQEKQSIIYFKFLISNREFYRKYLLRNQKKQINVNPSLYIQLRTNNVPRREK